MIEALRPPCDSQVAAMVMDAVQQMAAPEGEDGSTDVTMQVLGGAQAGPGLRPVLPQTLIPGNS